MTAVQTADPCRPIAVHDAAIIQLRMLENDRKKIQSDSTPGDIAGEREATIRSLSCSPADPFLWLTLFTLDHHGKNLTPREIDYLRLSYQLGPNEGWISVKRNPVVISFFAELPDDLKAKALREFSGIVDMSYIEASRILTGPGWPIHDTMLAQLVGVNERARKALAQDLYESGYDVSVPGIEQGRSRH